MKASSRRQTADSASQVLEGLVSPAQVRPSYLSRTRNQGSILMLPRKWKLCKLSYSVCILYSETRTHYCLQIYNFEDNGPGNIIQTEYAQ